LPLGPSSIGQYPGGYVQNEVATARHAARIDQGDFAFARGHRFSSTDKAEGWLIERILCDFSFAFDEFMLKFGSESDRMIAVARFLAANDKTGYVEIKDGIFKIKPDAWPLARAIASRFDSWLQSGELRYSRAV
jgi:oxygen-independent coproporphyrinogen III oxidase